LKAQRNNIFCFIYCLLFFAAVITPAALTPFAPGGADRDEDNAGGEFDFSTGFGLRKQLIALDAGIKTALFKESPNPKVTYGKEGWLFLTETLDWNAVPNRPDEITAARIARTLWLIDEYINKNGAQFIFTVAPNKARIYHDFLPYYKPWPGSGGRILYDLVMERADDLGIRRADLGALFTRLRRDNPGAQYYHRLDSHWNNLGAAEAYREIMTAIGRALAENGGPAGPDGIVADAGPDDIVTDAGADGGTDAGPLHLFEYDDYLNVTPRFEQDWPGDLDRMLNPLSDKTDAQYYYDIKNIYKSRKPIVNPEEMNISSASDINGVRVLFFRDSFANALIQFFSNNLGEAAYSRSMPFSLSRAEDGAYDAVVAEIVERNLHWIVAEAPDIPAPLRARAPSAESGGGVDGMTESEKLFIMLDNANPLPEGAISAELAEKPPDAPLSGGAAITGSIKPDTLPAGSEIRIFPVFESENGGETLIFEAFPIPESGFTFQVNEEELPEGGYIVKILICRDFNGNISAFGISEPLMTYSKINAITDN